MAASRVLVIGGTGYVGQFITKAGPRSGHPTFALIRESSATNPEKAKLLEEFKAAGVQIVYGDYKDHETLVKAIKGVDVVISTVGHSQILDQLKFIDAIKEAGNIKRFLPSEFGNDVDRTSAIDLAKSLFSAKSQIRRAVKEAKIPHTIVSANFTFGYFLPSLGQASSSLPVDKVTIFGDGNAKVIFNLEDDIGTFAYKAADDPRTLNKIVYLRPAGNIYSHNELVDLWEKKTGKKFERVYVSEEDVIKLIKEASGPRKEVLDIHYCAFVKGDHTSFEIDPSDGLEATQLYPDVKYTTVDEYLDGFL
ncbi:Isoflavone reductase-like protein [Apostasia shenzhenica]|uniref:Isoflavone reductase-like protein n=1 Tax=Apostasia shenzhenica TaxID=1088818 RepID=A0A2I0AEB6_9ASPA|nr:Isoflavone reductase-like protein [Apostasia shenzhenica]